MKEWWPKIVNSEKLNIGSSKIISQIYKGFGPSIPDNPLNVQRELIFKAFENVKPSGETYICFKSDASF